MGFEENVFINCPFDEEYSSQLRPLLFTVIFLGLTPRIALESLDCGKPRIDKIISIITESKYSIHDLSRIKAKMSGECFRLNMPFELGLDIGCRHYKKGKWALKRCLILEKEKYRYQAALSDIAGSDIEAHNDEPTKVVSIVRNWLNSELKKNAQGPTAIWNLFNDFMAYIYDSLPNIGYSIDDINGLPVNELISHMKAWVTDYQSRCSSD